MKKIFFPKNFLVKIFSLLLTIGLIFLIPNTFAQPLIYPTGVPDNEVEGGYFSRVLKNILSGCHNGQVISGFSYSGNLLNSQAGTPKCVPLNNLDGQASSLTGAMIGAEGNIPMWTAGGTSFTGSEIIQKNGNIGIGTDDPSVKLDISGQIKIKDGTQGSGRILVSDVSGLSSWKKFSEIFQISDAKTDFITAMKNIFPSLCVPAGTGDNNTCYGEGSLRDNTTGSKNTALGSFSLHRNLEGNNNTALGHFSLSSNTSGNANTALGHYSLSSNTSGYGNIALGDHSLSKNIVGYNNIALGRYSLFNNTSGNYNTALGYHSLYNNISGESNTTLGHFSLSSNTSGNYNTALGYHSLSRNTSGYNNVGIGMQTLSALSGGNYNVAIGGGAGLNLISGDNNIAIGADVRLPSYTGSNQLNIGNWIYGSGGNIGIGTSTPSAKLDIAGKIKITDGTQGSGKILMSDANGLARWETINLSAEINSNDCGATSKSVNGHTYPVIALVNGNSYISTFIESIANGRRQWNQEFLCTRGSIGPSGGETSEIFCNNGYTATGTACIKPDPVSTTPVNCTAKTMVVNGRTYNVPVINHNFSAVVHATATIENGVTNYKQTFECNNGTTRVSGSEEIISQTCNTDYAWNGNACVQSNNQEVIDAYAGTTCDTTNIQVVDVAPGLNKIPENLNANTLYRLQSGTYRLSRGIKANICTAIIGADKDNTILQYAAPSSNSVNLIDIANKSVVLKNFKILGKNDRMATVIARAINISEGGGKAILDGLNIQYAGHSGIFIQGAGDNTLTNITISDVSAVSKSSYGIQLSSSDNTLTNITISDVSSNGRESSYGIQLSSPNNTLTNITISNVSMSGTFFVRDASYGIQLSSSDNTLTNITISDISSKGSAHHSKSYGIQLSSSSSNNTLTNIAISNISSDSMLSSDSYGIELYYSSSNTLTNITISDISSIGSSIGIQLVKSSSNTFTNITIANFSSDNTRASSIGISLVIASSSNTFTNITIANFSSNFYSSTSTSLSNVGISLSSSSSSNIFLNININNIHSASSYGVAFTSSYENVFSNFSITKTKTGIAFSSNSDNNIFHNGIIYKNLEGIRMGIGNNNAFSNISIYDNDFALKGEGNSNFYYGNLRVFANGNNSISGLTRGLASHWLGGFTDGTLITTGSYSEAWAIRPTNVSGYNHNVRGPQTGLTWTLPITWSYGNSVPRQVAPVISSSCNLSVTSTTRCQPTFGGMDTYNATKKIGEW